MLLLRFYYGVIHMHDETIRFTASLPKALFDKMETELDNKNYQSRSEYIRDLFRDRLVDNKWEETEDDVIGVLTLMFDQYRKGLYEKMMNIQYDHYHLVQILCSTHINLDQDHCLENMTIKGNPEKIRAIVNQLSALKGVEFARLTSCCLI